MFVIGNPGGAFNDFGQLGYIAIGSGGLHAVQSMIGFSHTSSHTLSQTVFAVYVSKRRAEVAPGVGKDTDLAIITNSGIAHLTVEQLNSLEELREEYQRPVSQELQDKLKALQLPSKEDGPNE